jgi:hypothetical protein
VQPVAEDRAEPVNLRLWQSGLGERDQQLAQQGSHSDDRQRPDGSRVTLTLPSPVLTPRR